MIAKLKVIIIDISIALTIGTISFLLTNSFTWTFSFVILSLILSLCVHIQYSLQKLPKEIMESDLYRMFCDIINSNNSYFTEIAREKILHLKVCLSSLKNGVYEVQGNEVYSTYIKLIGMLKKSDEYFATTYIEDTFWDEEGGKRFLEANKRALIKGAKITRIFLYSEGDDIESFSAIRMHRELFTSLSLNHRQNLILKKMDRRKIDTVNQIASDIGILKDTYIMQLNTDPRATNKRALITIGLDNVKIQHQYFQNLLNDLEIKDID